MARQPILSNALLDIDEIAPTGEGIGYWDGLLVYVPYALPGERVHVEFTEQRRTFARARVVEVITPSPDRLMARCLYFGYCGGCDWQHMAYSAQLAHKREFVRRQIIDVAKLSDPVVRPCVSSLHPYGYRSAAQFAVLPNGRPAYRTANPRESIEVNECPILEPLLEAELQKAALSGVTARREWQPRVPGPLLVGEYNYYVGPKSPFPVNILVADRLVEEVIDALEPAADKMVLDLFCGVGLFTLPLAVMSKDVVGVEPNGEVARDARRNVASIQHHLAGKAPPRILSYALGSVLARPEIKTRGWDGVVVTAPSNGLHLTTANQIGKLGVPRLVYVSSDLSTLGRDVKAFVSTGYQLSYVQPLDMFPQTRQVQTVVLMSRQNP